MTAAELSRVETVSGESPASSSGDMRATNSGLKYKIIRKGTGARPNTNSTVLAHYRGWLDDGTEFDSSYKRGEPTEFPLRGVIGGWTEGLQLINEGGKIELEIPSDLGYGDQGMPLAGIPGGATLHFEIELVKVVN
ncbi:MAG: FKBP-type peptidyl-prolyl cis-trans isomerase [Planctomycetaceae bacterium]|nr:FKBP-type peptidyl-prolyl cis-trans isomerase [Planctomycetaceae bacterium]